MASEVEELVGKIEKAFAHRLMPPSAIDYECESPDSDVEDALWFSGKDRGEVTWKDWRDHMSAWSFMSTEAAAYYLPSLLILSARNPEWTGSLDSLISCLDKAPGVERENQSLKGRFLWFRTEEYEVMKEWLVYMSEHYPDFGYGRSRGGPGDSYARAFETIDFLQQETELLNQIEKES